MECKRINDVHPEDLIPVIHCGEDRAISIEHLIHLLRGILLLHILPDDLFNKIISAFENSKTAFVAANKSYDIALNLSMRLDLVEEDILKIKSDICEINIKIKNLDEKVELYKTYLNSKIEEYNTRLLNNINKVELEAKVKLESSDKDTYIEYIIKLGGIEVGTIKVPKSKAKITFSNGRFNPTNYDPNKEDITVNIPMYVSDLSDAINYVKSARINNGNTVYPDSEGTLNLHIDNRLSLLEDVSITNVTAGDILYYNGSTWINTNLQELIETLIKNGDTIIDLHINNLIDAKMLWTTTSDNKVTPKESREVTATKIYSTSND